MGMDVAGKTVGGISSRHREAGKFERLDDDDVRGPRQVGEECFSVGFDDPDGSSCIKVDVLPLSLRRARAVVTHRFFNDVNFEHPFQTPHLVRCMTYT